MTNNVKTKYIYPTTEDIKIAAPWGQYIEISICSSWQSVTRDPLFVATHNACHQGWLLTMHLFRRHSYRIAVWTSGDVKRIHITVGS
uniref:Uncharacterized protein n=1 Tax=Arundo donax TaxID=35708 RepID=A0A0A9BUX4_ARUDO